MATRFSVEDLACLPVWLAPASSDDVADGCDSRSLVKSSCSETPPYSPDEDSILDVVPAWAGYLPRRALLAVYSCGKIIFHAAAAPCPWLRGVCAVSPAAAFVVRPLPARAVARGPPKTTPRIWALRGLHEHRGARALLLVFSFLSRRQFASHDHARDHAPRATRHAKEEREREHTRHETRDIMYECTRVYRLYIYIYIYIVCNVRGEREQRVYVCVYSCTMYTSYEYKVAATSCTRTMYCTVHSLVYIV